MNKSICIGIAALLLGSCQENFDSRLEREAQEYTQRHCPYTESDGTVLDSMTYDASTRTLTHWYSLQSTIDTPEICDGLIRNEATARKALLEQLRGNTKWESCKERDVKFDYIYHSNATGKFIFHIKFTPEDYRR